MPKLPVLLALLLMLWPMAGGAEAPALQHRGVALAAWPPSPEDRFDVTLLPAAEGLQRLRAALDEIHRRSPASARAIETLQRDGQVTLAYHPHTVGDTSRLNAMNIALFIPDHGRRGGLPEGRSYLVVVNQHGIKWPLRELAAVIVHELAGHGMQHFRGRLATLRPLDRECEAYLYEERANQDLGLDKDSAEMIQFRKALENRYCSDFKTHMRAAAPRSMALWDRRNPDVGALLAAFESYLRSVRPWGGQP